MSERNSIQANGQGWVVIVIVCGFAVYGFWQFVIQLFN